MARKIPHAPSWIEVTLGAALSFVLGVVLAATYLVLRPVVQVKQMPKEAEIEAGAIYYLKGSHDTGKTRDVQSKRAQFVQGKSVQVIEDEINILAGPAAPVAKPAPPAPKKPGEVVPDLNAGAQISPPNFRVRGNTVQIAVPLKVSAFGLEGNVVVISKGTFVHKDSGFVYEPTSLTVGSCALDRLPVVFGLVYNKFIGLQPIPPDIAAAWSKLVGVHVEGDLIKLTMP